MVTIKIGERDYPLALTVASVDKMEDLCGGLANIPSYMGSGDFKAAGAATCNVLAELMAEGEAAAALEAALAGEERAAVRVPTAEELGHLLSPAMIVVARSAAMEAVMASIARTIEVADDPKNADGGAGTP